MAVILVTHNLGIVSQLADDVAVMYAGNIVEYAPAQKLFSKPAHPYTRALLRAVPRPGGTERLETIPGKVPAIADFPAGCRFAGRCSCARESCISTFPELVRIDEEHFCRCPWSEK